MASRTNELKQFNSSPCVRNCCLDENDVCIGCGRHLKEILAWQDSSEAEREKILALAKRRISDRHG